MITVSTYVLGKGRRFVTSILLASVGFSYLEVQERLKLNVHVVSRSFLNLFTGQNPVLLILELIPNEG